MNTISKTENQLDIPKLNEFYDLICTEEKIRVGELFISSERIVGISEIFERNGEELIRISEYNSDNNCFLNYTWESISRDKFLEKYSHKWVPDYKKYSQLAEDFLFNGKEIEEEIFEEESNALVHKTNKVMLESIYGGLEVKKKSLEIVRNMAQIKILEQKNKLEVIKQKLESKLAVFHKEMEKIYRVISMIELYLGVEEELHQIKQGTPADINEPLSLRQLTLYADEELGNTYDGGIDYTKLNLFDEWLIKENNYKMLLPEERGIVAIKPRRRDKRYSDDHFENAERNRWNKQTYFLIRNGENIYRVCTEHLSVGKTLFPLRHEFDELINKSEDDWSELRSSRLKDQKESLTNQYMRIVLFIQGLIDRTEVFNPIQPGVKVTELEENGSIRLIYDAEMLLPSGRLSFKDWMKEINSNVGRGSRIVLVPETSERHSRNGCNRGIYNKEGFVRYYSGYQPETPHTGLYIVEEFIVESNDSGLVIYYNPKDTLWYNGYERKKRIGWAIDLNSSWYLNYDRISLDDIDFYLSSRLERENYLENLPLLRDIKKHLLEEQKKENDFKLMLRGIAISDGQKDDGVLTEKIQESIDWWKYKNIWKRPITQDDSKACRMIQKRLLRK